MENELLIIARACIGSALAACGLSILLTPGLGRIQRYFGRVPFLAGLLFISLAFNLLVRIPLDLLNAIQTNLIFLLADSLYRVILFLFGGRRHRSLAKKTFILGFCWAQAAWILPLIDPILGLPVVAVLADDGHAYGPVHLASSLSMYVWPLLPIFLAFRQARWGIFDYPVRGYTAKTILLFVLTIGACLAFCVAALVAGSPAVCDLAFIALECCAFVWVLAVARAPKILKRVHLEIHESHERRTVLDPGEAEIIEKRLNALVSSERYRQPNLSIATVSKIVGSPSYRLSRYFNERLGTSYPLWINDLRIKWVCARLEDSDLRAIGRISADAGYNSKSVFNSHFTRVTGLSPREYARARGSRERERANG
jgi:AraC-like DNA-binding protein